MRKDFLTKIAMLIFTSWMYSTLCVAITVAEPLVWDFKDYQFQIEPQLKKDKSAVIPFITATLSQSPGEEVDLFGVVFKTDEADTFWVYEIYDIEAAKVIKRISVNEMLGVTQDRGCAIAERQSLEETKTLITRYRVNVDEYDLILTRVIKCYWSKNEHQK